VQRLSSRTRRGQDRKRKLADPHLPDARAVTEGQQRVGSVATARRSRAFEPAPPDPGIRPGGVRDRALRALGVTPADLQRATTSRKGGTA
jgi:hypothetical protein